MSNTPHMMLAFYRSKTQTQKTHDYTIWPLNESCGIEFSYDDVIGGLLANESLIEPKVQKTLEDALAYIQKEAPSGAVINFKELKPKAFIGSLKAVPRIDLTKDCSSASHIAVLDIDIHSEGSINPSQLNNIVPSPSLIQQTKSGGIHLIFTSNPDDLDDVSASGKSALAGLWVEHNIKNKTGIDYITQCSMYGGFSRFLMGGGDLKGKNITRLAGVYGSQMISNDSLSIDFESGKRYGSGFCPFADHGERADTNKGLVVGNGRLYCHRCGRGTSTSNIFINEAGRFELRYKNHNHLYKLYKNKNWGIVLTEDLERLLRHIDGGLPSKYSDSHKRLIIRSIAKYVHGHCLYIRSCLRGEDFCRTIPDVKALPVWTTARGVALAEADVNINLRRLPTVMYERYNEKKGCWYEHVDEDKMIRLKRVIHPNIPTFHFESGYRPIGVDSPIDEANYTIYINPSNREGIPIPSRLPQDYLSLEDAISIVQDRVQFNQPKLKVTRRDNQKNVVVPTYEEAGATPKSSLKPIPTENLVAYMLGAEYCRIPKQHDRPIFIAHGVSGSGKSAIPKIANALLLADTLEIPCTGKSDENIAEALGKGASAGNSIIILDEYFKDHADMEPLFGQIENCASYRALYRGNVTYDNKSLVCCNGINIPETVTQSEQSIRRAFFAPKLQNAVSNVGEKWNKITKESLYHDDDLLLASQTIASWIRKATDCYHHDLSTDEGRYMGTPKSFEQFYDDFKSKHLKHAPFMFLNEAERVTSNDIREALREDNFCRSFIKELIQSTEAEGKSNKHRHACVIDINTVTGVCVKFKNRYVKECREIQNGEPLPTKIISDFNESRLIDNVDIELAKEGSKVLFRFKYVVKPEDIPNKQKYIKLESLRKLI